MSNLPWEKSTEEKFDQMIAKVPVFMRGIAKSSISKKAESLASENNRLEVIEKDMVDAFFAETPGGFYGPMKVDMEALDIDYTKYGYERDEWKNIMGQKE